jgi:hypothetical protein
MDWLTPMLAFVGGATGAAASYVAAQRSTRQRERQGQREEWGRRFTTALADVGSEDFRRRVLGRVVLVQLAESELADVQDRQLADTVLEMGARLDADGDDVTLGVAGATVDLLEFVEDTGE